MLVSGPFGKQKRDCIFRKQSQNSQLSSDIDLAFYYLFKIICISKQLPANVSALILAGYTGSSEKLVVAPRVQISLLANVNQI